MMRKLRKIFSLAVLMGLIMALGAVPAAYAGLAAFSPNPAFLNGVSIGGIPAFRWMSEPFALTAMVNISFKSI